MINDVPFDVAASTSSGLALDYAVSGPASISGTTITLDGTPGTVEVVVSQAGDGNYNAAEESVTFTVSDPNKASQAITFEAISDRVFGSGSFELTVSSSSGLSVDLVVVEGNVSISGTTVTMLGVGDVTIRASQDGNDDFNPASAVEQSFSLSLIHISEPTRPY